MQSRDNSEKEVSDAELLHSMATDRRDPQKAATACAIFYERHYRYLYAVCLHAYEWMLGNARIADLVQETLIRAYQKAGTYKADARVEDQQGQSRLVRGWLGRISENIVHDYFRDQPQVAFIDDYDLAEHPEPDPADTEPASDRLRRLELAMSQLSPREQDVLRETVFWYKPGEKHQRLPNSVMQQLAASLGTTPANIRKIRQRALAKLKNLTETI